MTICLVMNVRDSADTLPAAAESVKGLIDTWLLVDTGSSDNTRELAGNVFDVDGLLLEHKWVDFGYNRTVAVQAAKGMADWMLWMDDDTTYGWHPEMRRWLDANGKVVDCWNVEVINGNISYQLPLLMRGDLSWRYTGRVHEYLEPDGRSLGTLLGLTLYGNSGDGRSYEQDLELLAHDVGSDPRATFYYAQTLKDLGRTDEAVEAYRLRARMEGWEEETWYAMYMAAKLSEDVAGLLNAHQRRPWRHEPLTAAGRILASQESPDTLFKETV